MTARKPKQPAKPKQSAKAKPAAAKPATPARELNALRAKLAAAEGKKLTQAQARDLAWYDKQATEDTITAALGAIPKGVFCQLAGRQQKVIDEQADRYDLPIDGPTIDMFAAIKAYHDLITANARFIRPADDAELADAGGLSVEDARHHDLQTEKLRQEVIKLRQSNERLAIQVTRDRGDSIDRRTLREMLAWLSTRLEGLGQQLRRAADGTEAQKTLNEFLDHLADECDQGVLRV
jgi:hypothetical protein